MSSEEDIRICKGIMVFIFLLVFSIVLGLSFALVAPTEVAMRYNPNTKRLDQGTIWENGRHAVPPGGYFYKYPTSLQNLLYSYENKLGGWTKDKQELSMHLSVQMRLIPGVS